MNLNAMSFFNERSPNQRIMKESQIAKFFKFENNVAMLEKG